MKALMVATLLCMVVGASSEWVDYPISGVRCCSNIPVEECEPESKVSNSACRDVCHYGGCSKGGQCEYMGLTLTHVCHCNC